MFIECLEISIRFALGLFQVHVAIFPDGLDDKGRQQEEEEEEATGGGGGGGGESFRSQ